MGTILEAVAFLLAANGHGTIGTDLFMGEMQDEPDVCRAVFESPGTKPIKTMGPGSYRVDRPRTRVVVRGARDDYPGARDEAKEIRLLLDGISEQPVDGFYIHEIASMGGVEPLGKDSDDRPLFAVDFETWTQP
jgi:hypothetical protein